MVDPNLLCLSDWTYIRGTWKNVMRYQLFVHNHNALGLAELLLIEQWYGLLWDGISVEVVEDWVW